MSDPLKQVTRWQTSDGEEHSSRECAEQWQAKIDAAIVATRQQSQAELVPIARRAEQLGED